jgi:hypothetical protein
VRVISGPALLRRGAAAVAAGRVALGLTALVWPSVPARPWVGASADELAARVFGRALGARDVALGLGALAALRHPAAVPRSPRAVGEARPLLAAAEPGSPRVVDEAWAARAWMAAGALSDALDVAASLAAWRELPRTGRWLVAVSAGGAALAGAAGALAMRPGQNGNSA